MSRVLGLDLDGVLCHGFGSYESRKPDRIQIHRARQLAAKGWRIHIWTAREDTHEGRARTMRWLMRHRVPCNRLRMGKPTFDAIVDDRALAEIPEDLEAFDHASHQPRRMRGLKPE